MAVGYFDPQVQSSMISVYRGSDYFEAQLLKGLMEQQGLQVFLQGGIMHAYSSARAQKL